MLAQIARVFLVLGLRSFGGPIAHLGYFRAELVEKRRWLDDAHFADLVALCQFLPGPASSQVVFAIGSLRAGWLGGIVASVCFTLPSLLLMIGVAYGLAYVGEIGGALHGLKLAAVAVVAQAVAAMAKRLWPDRARASVGLAAAAALLLVGGPLAQIATIAAGGALGWLCYRHAPLELPDAPPLRTGSRAAGLVALGLFAALLVVLPLVRSQGRMLAEVDVFYRAGALVFGGGHVVLPLLRAEFARTGWLSDGALLAGYGAAQALPGPLFAIAGYLGAAIPGDAPPWLAGVACAFAIFLPGWLLVGGALPFWHRARAIPWVRAALAGANAAVVGLLIAALIDPVIATSVRDPRDAAAALVAFGALQYWAAPPWLVVGALAAAGQWLL